MSWENVEVRVTNPGQTAFVIEADSWKLKKFKDPRRPREFDMNMSRSVPVKQFALLEVLEGSDVIFRGIAEKYKISKTQKTIQSKGVEWLLFHRYTPMFNYCYTDVTMLELFRDCWDSMYGIPGLLRVANSYCPTATPYSMYDAAKNIVKLIGAGSGSRIGAADISMLTEELEQPLIRRAALADLQTYDQSVYQDATDLYVRYDGSSGGGAFANWFWYLNGGLMAENAFDTMIRLGQHDGESTILTGGLMVDYNQIGDLLCNLAESHGYYIRWRDGATYTYLDVRSEPGDGAASGLYELTEDDIDLLEKSVPQQAKIHSLTGMGDACQQYHTAGGDLTYKGLWVADIYDFENGFRDANGTLIPYTNDEFARRQADYKYRIKTPRRLLMLPGDYIKINVDYEPVEILPSDTIEISSSDQSTTIELGGRDPDFVDAFEALQSFDEGYYDRYMIEYFGEITQSGTFKFRDNNHFTCAPCVLGFAVPPDAKHADLNARITLDVNFGMDNYVRRALGRWCAIVMTASRIPAGRLTNFMLGDALTRIDVTDFVTENATTNFNFYLYLTGNFTGSHSDCTGHPDIQVSATMRFWKRAFTPS
jgi:hypothetical protein